MDIKRNFQLCIDKGNTYTKIAVFRNNTIVYEAVHETISEYDLSLITNKFDIEACILSDVGIRDEHLEGLLNEKFPTSLIFDDNVALPIVNGYETPSTLGKDRLAAVVGAVTMKPDSDILIVDAGTAITYDLVDAKGYYHGGNIAPGLAMRLRALHTVTGRLPLVKVEKCEFLLGNNTADALLAGAFNGIVFEIIGYFDALKIKYPELSFFLTGGDSNYFVSKLKSPIFAEKNLVLTGLNRILQFNVKK